jgi:hypothetical protein
MSRRTRASMIASRINGVNRLDYFVQNWVA